MSEVEIYNPENKALEELPAIMCFSNVKGGGDGIALAIAESGWVLGSHWCSHEAYVRNDLGVSPGSRPDRHETYRNHYPHGYKMEFIPSEFVLTHEKLNQTLERNKKLQEEDRKQTQAKEGDKI